MNYNFDVCPARQGTESEKWGKYPADVLPLWVADMDFISPEPVRQALLERVAQGIFGYGRDLPELRDLIVARLAERYAWQILPEDIVFMPGAVRGFNLACHALAEPGGGVLAQTPLYPPALAAPQNAGLNLQVTELRQEPDGAYSVDWESFEAALTPETRLFILCNPHNPVGRVFRPDELSRMAEACLRRGVTICSDEVHADLLYYGQVHTPIAALDPEIARHTITLMAPSKTFNIAGLDCSYAIIQNPELRQRYQLAARGLVSGINILGWTAAIAAYRGGQEWLTQALAYLEANRDFLYDFVQSELPGIKMTKPEGTYLAWLDCRETYLEDPYQFFLQNARVALNDGKTFGQGGQGFVRLNFACSRATLAEALARIKLSLGAQVSPAWVENAQRLA
jgi:cystathionine beta-lyase